MYPTRANHVEFGFRLNQERPEMSVCLESMGQSWPNNPTQLNQYEETNNRQFRE